MACRAGAEQDAHSPRRQFVTTSLAAGFAAAVSPIELRAVIHTDASALIAGELRIPTSTGSVPAYRAQPDKGDHLPTILVVHEIFGVHEHIRDVCRRFAKLGYLAIAPDLFARYGDAPAISDMQALMRDVVSKVTDTEVLSDLDATARWAADACVRSARLSSNERNTRMPSRSGKDGIRRGTRPVAMTSSW